MDAFFKKDIKVKQNIILYAAQVSIWSHDSTMTKVSAYSADSMEILDQLLNGPYQQEVIKRVMALKAEFDADA